LIGIRCRQKQNGYPWRRNTAVVWPTAAIIGNAPQYTHDETRPYVADPNAKWVLRDGVKAVRPLLVAACEEASLALKDLPVASKMNTNHPGTVDHWLRFVASSGSIAEKPPVLWNSVGNNVGYFKTHEMQNDHIRNVAMSSALACGAALCLLHDHRYTFREHVRAVLREIAALSRYWHVPTV